MNITVFQRRIVIGLAVGIVGVLVSLGIEVLADINKSTIVPLGATLSVFVGAAVAGIICADMFGHGGYLGWIYALLGAIAATALGAFIAGTLLLPVEGGLYGMVAVFDVLTTQFIVLAAWCVMMGVVHQAIVFKT